MAMSVGALGIMTCPGGTCSSIACVVCGSVAGPQSLKNLATQAGISTASMRNFAGTTIGDLAVCPTPISSISAAGSTCPTYLCSVCPNTTTVSAACTWLHPCASPVTPNPATPGASLNVGIDANAGVARSGYVTYTPAHCGSVQCVCFCQLAATVWKCVYLGTCTTYGCGLSRLAYQYATNTVTPALSNGECYCVCIAYSGSCSISTGSVLLYVLAGGSVKLNCTVLTTCVSSSLSFTVCYGQTFTLCVCACKGAQTGTPRGYVGISRITAIVGSECLGSPISVCAYTCNA